MRFWTISCVSFFFRVASHNTLSVAGHWALWHKGIEQGDISIGNLMCDPVTKRGVLNDFDLARLSTPNRQPSATDNTGTLPFLALDLLNERAFKGLVPRLYRHEAESFTWCLIYVCICMWEDSGGRVRTRPGHPLSSWSLNMDSCHSSKADLSDDGLLNEFPRHQDLVPLAFKLYDYWMRRYRDQKQQNIVQNLSKLGVSGSRRGLTLQPGRSVDREDPAPVQTTKSYKELPNLERFKQVFELILSASDVIPDSKDEILSEMVTRVSTLYLVPTNVEGETGASN